MYKLTYRKAVLKDLKNTPQETRELIDKRIDQLEINPRPEQCKKLHGYLKLWRIKQGDYRIVYNIDDEKNLVNVLAVGHRKDIYRMLNQLF